MVRNIFQSIWILSAAWVALRDMHLDLGTFEPPINATPGIILGSVRVFDGVPAVFGIVIDPVALCNSAAQATSHCWVGCGFSEQFRVFKVGCEIWKRLF